VANGNGEYRLANLPAGTYEIAVPQMGLRTARYAQPDVVIEAARTLTFNIMLMRTTSASSATMRVPADVQQVRRHQGSGAATRDGHPDFSGVWLANVDPNPEPAQMLPWAVTEWNRRRDRAFEGCRPRGALRRTRR